MVQYIAVKFKNGWRILQWDKGISHTNNKQVWLYAPNKQLARAELSTKLSRKSR